MRHSDHFDFMAALVMFQSYPAHEFLGFLLPFPSVKAISNYFQGRLNAPRYRLLSIDQISDFLNPAWPSTRKLLRAQFLQSIRFRVRVHSLE
jgi:hypothetical protein